MAQKYIAYAYLIYYSLLWKAMPHKSLAEN